MFQKYIKFMNSIYNNYFQILEYPENELHKTNIVIT